MSETDRRPIILITGAEGNLGRSLGRALGLHYRIAGLDRTVEDGGFEVFEADFTSDAAVELALRKFRDTYGSRIASVIHLVAYFDFTGKDNSLYQSVNLSMSGALSAFCARFRISTSGNSFTRVPCWYTRLAT